MGFSVGESEDGHSHSHQVLWRHRDEKVIIIDGYEEIHIIILAWNMDRVNHTYQPFGSLICRGFYYKSRRTFPQSLSAISEDSCCLDMHVCKIVSVKSMPLRK